MKINYTIDPLKAIPTYETCQRGDRMIDPRVEKRIWKFLYKDPNKNETITRFYWNNGYGELKEHMRWISKREAQELISKGWEVLT